ncbi:hypothetical protein A5886_002191 [Enterococcus sp. 8G7_MSG3316]|uniref:Uncharacterized protein n=1 Tax=Candidatus Enterococcus testudinis TaxID=1834191 RepID=A0A242A8Q7_9ENTE|nr:hypothetical protein [Enterococcus sp. 8G7_MSG3316]OTN77111.1 hypothetical protein A5886_002191 [Enterococcus sp. 8G7_MSG3316]
MNEKITNLITALALECRANNVTLSLCAFNDKGLASLSQVGSNTQIEMSIFNQLAQWEENLKLCDCRECKSKLSQLQEDELKIAEEDKQIDSNDISEKLAAFFRGDLV